MLSWIGSMAPKYFLDGSNIKIITSPNDFYDVLKQKAITANKRIVLSSLYIGTGPLEKDLVRSLEKACSSSDRDINFRLKVLLECTRGSRLSTSEQDPVSSRTMLTPLLSANQNKIRVSLFHSPRLRSWLKFLLPRKLHETLNLQHMKVYIFDDDVMLSGANLSADYFTNRQDRCVLVERCPQLADFYERLIDVVAGVSYTLTPDNTLLPPEGGLDPTTVKPSVFRTEFHNRMSQFLLSEQGLSMDCPSNSAQDTVISPLIQIALANVRQDERVTRYLLSSGKVCHPGSVLDIASGYFNLIEDYESALLDMSSTELKDQSSVNVNICTASPKGQTVKVMLVRPHLSCRNMQNHSSHPLKPSMRRIKRTAFSMPDIS